MSKDTVKKYSSGSNDKYAVASLILLHENKGKHDKYDIVIDIYSQAVVAVIITEQHINFIITSSVIS